MQDQACALARVSRAPFHYRAHLCMPCMSLHTRARCPGRRCPPPPLARHPLSSFATSCSRVLPC
jgi:hypothetical protein